MNFVPNWRRVLRKAWSVRLILLAGLLSGLEVVLPLTGDFLPIDTGAFAALSGLSVTAAFVTRILVQKDLNDES